MEQILKNVVVGNSELKMLSEYLPGKIICSDDFSCLKLNPNIGNGEVCFHNLQEGLKVYDFDITLTNDCEVLVDTISVQTLQFLYCFHGEFQHQFNKNDAKVFIEQFQSAVAHSNTGISSRVFMPKNKRLIFNVILVDKEEYFKKFDEEPQEFTEQLKEVLQEISEEAKYFHAGGFNLKIAEQLKLLYGMEHANDVSEKLSRKGRYYIVLAKQIVQFYQEINNTSNSSDLSKSELSKIFELGNFIRKSPELQHSIKQLTAKTGLSPAKLQNGFKYMYQRTVSDFIRSIRLEKSVFLIRTTDLTISEVVYSVGFTSRSYFCKIFKKNYHCSPKEFKQKMNS